MQKIAVALLISIVFIHSAYALSTTIQPSYSQGETILIEITGSIRSPIQSSDVEFTRGHVQVGSFEYDLKRLGDRYFLYAIAPFSPNNYTLIIHGVETFVNGQAVIRDIVENFSITNETAPYTLKPGFALTAQDMDVTIVSHQDDPQEIATSLESNGSFTIQSGENRLHLDVSSFEYGLHVLIIGKYEFLLYSLREGSTTQPRRPHTIEFSPLRIEERFVRTREPRIITFVITNIADHNLEDFNFQYDKDRYELTPTNLRSLDINETATFNLTLIKEEDVSDSVIVGVDGEMFELPLEVTFEDESQGLGNGTSSPNTQNKYYCAELNGNICLTTQQCSGESIDSLDGVCCRGTCIDVKDTGSLAWLGYLIGMIVLFIIAVVGGRYLKARSKAKKENPLSEQVKKLEKPF